MPEPSDAGAPDPAVEKLRVLLPSPIGDLGVELSDQALTRVLIDPPEEERDGFVPFDEVESSDFLDEVFGRFSEYFAGARRSLDLEYDLAPANLSSFNRRVLKETAKIPYGRTRTYGLVAERAGRADGYRMVLAALVENPLPVVLPCHRVVTHKSGIGSYVGGQAKKRWLLQMEREAVKQEED